MTIQPIAIPVALSETWPERIERLPALARNLWSTWNEAGRRLWQAAEGSDSPDGLHPVILLQDMPLAERNRLAADPAFLTLYDAAVNAWNDYRNRPSWFNRSFPSLSDTTIAYFSPEFGLHESLPLYSGGSSVLAGDHLKAASDLGIPLIGIGLLNKRGAFEQRIDAAGRQVAEPCEPNLTRLPLARAMTKAGAPLAVEVPLPGRSLKLNVWQVEVGRVRALLLDADVADNREEDRAITDLIQGSSVDARIAQAVTLGIGGMRALQALGIQPELCHINESLCSLAALERLGQGSAATGLSADTVLELVRSGTLLSLHSSSPVTDLDTFPRNKVEAYLSAILQGSPFPVTQALLLGQDPAADDRFSLTAFALNTSSFRNGISRTHGSVARQSLRPYHGRTPEDGVPITHITSGVHYESWAAPELMALFDRFLPGTWREHHTQERQWNGIGLVPPSSLWRIHQALKERMIRFVRGRLREQLKRQGASEAAIADASRALDPHVLTIGFAHPFASRKRVHLIFNDLARLRRLVNDDTRPIQLIFAGRADPDDAAGLELIRELHRVTQMEAFRGKIILLENYGIAMARHLVQGVDIWLSTPQPPLGTGGTSGQKAALNGVLNVSVLDGWWAEAYRDDIGWAIGGDPEATQEQGAEALYAHLEQELLPLYYNQGEERAQWAERMKRSITALSPAFSSQRMVEQYAREGYAPLIERHRLFSDLNAAVADRVVATKRRMLEHWHHVRIDGCQDAGNPSDRAAADEALSSFKRIEALVYAGPLEAKDIAVEAVYEAGPSSAVRFVVSPLRPVGLTAEGQLQYEGEVPRGLLFGPHYTLRVHPVCPEFAHPFELGCCTLAP